MSSLIHDGSETAGSRASRWLLQFIAGALVCVAGFLVLGSTADAAKVKKPKLTVAYGVSGKTVKVSASLKQPGVRKKARLGSRAVLVEKVPAKHGKKARWVVRAKGTVPRKRGRSNKFRLKWKVPGAKKHVKVRVRVFNGKRRVAQSPVRKLRFETAGVVAPKVVSPSPSQVSTAPSPDLPGQVVIEGERVLKAGEVIATGIGPATPHGFLGKVVSSQVKDGKTFVQTEPISLMEAAPNASFDVSGDDLQPTEDMSGGEEELVEALTGGPAMRPRAFSRLLYASNSGGGVNSGKKKAACGPSDAFKAEAGIQGSLGARFQMSWNNRLGVPASVKSATAQATLKLTQEVKLSSAVGVKCSKSFNLLPKKIELAPITFAIGPVPVVLVPELDVSLKISGEVAVKAEISAKTVTDVTAGIKYQDGKATPISSVSKNASADQKITKSASASATIGPKVGLKLYGVVGPAISIRGGIAATATEGANPWLTIKAQIDASAAIEFSVWKLSLSVSVDSPPINWTILTVAHEDDSVDPTDPTDPDDPDDPLEPTDPGDGDSMKIAYLNFGQLPAGETAVRRLFLQNIKNAGPYSFRIWRDPDNLAKVPSWVSMDTSGRVTIDPPLGTNRDVDFVVYVRDGAGEYTPIPRDIVRFSVRPTGWTASEAPRPPGTQGSFVTGFSCPSTNYCAGIGATTAGNYDYADGNGFIFEKEGDAWSQRPLPSLPGSSDPVQMGDTWLKCQAPQRCVGVLANGSDSGSIIEEDANGWQAIPVPDAPDGSQMKIRDFDCPPLGNCVAVGMNYEETQPVVLQQHQDGDWSTSVPDLPPGGECDFANYSLRCGLDLVSCPAENRCLAIGDYFSGYFDRVEPPPYEPSYFRTFSLAQSGSEGWQASDLPPVFPRTPNDRTITPEVNISAYGLACPEVAQCIVTGRAFPADYYVGHLGVGGGPYSMVLKSGHWSTASIPLPAVDEGGIYSDLSQGGALVYGYSYVSNISCPTLDSCSAGGRYSTSSFGSPYLANDLLFDFDGSSWTAVDPGLKDAIDSLDCPSADSCVAFGSPRGWYGDAAPYEISLKSGGSWTRFQAPLASTALYPFHGYEGYDRGRTGFVECPEVGECEIAASLETDADDYSRIEVITQNGSPR